MGVVDERHEGCDGCGRTVPLKELTTVSMPDGDTLACCRRCEPHARSAAKKLAELDTNRTECDGCDTEFKTASLEDVVLTDGTVITVCPDCLREVPGRVDSGGKPSVTDHSGAETTEIARRKDLCGQCHEWFDEELFHVTLIDGRTEEMCSSCRDRAVDDGIATDVKMRKTEAREILDVGTGASTQEIRRAFLMQIKHAHPDRASGSREAFKLVKEAYDRLS